MSDLPSNTTGNGRFDAWQELERALSLVHVAGLELLAEIETGGEQPESAARQKFEEALADFHDALAVVGILPSSLRITVPAEG